MTAEKALEEWMRTAQNLAENDGMSPIPGKGIESGLELLGAALAEARAEAEEKIDEFLAAHKAKNHGSCQQCGHRYDGWCNA